MTDAEHDASEVEGREPSSGAEDAGQQSARDFLPIILGVVAPTAVLTALLYYVGWVVTSAQASVFGLDESALGYSTRDYLLRSSGALFVPMVGLLLLGVVWVWAHTVLMGWLERPDRQDAVARLAWILLTFGVVALVIGLLGAFRPPVFGAIVPPLALAVGISLCAYGTFLRRRQRPSKVSAGPLLQALSTTMVVLLVALSVFWVIGDYAERVGRERARRAAQRLGSRPSVTVYSPNPLHIEGPGVRETELPGSGPGERYRYDGLKLLFWANGKYFLVPDGWSEMNGTTIVLADTPALRLEFSKAA